MKVNCSYCNEEMDLHMRGLHLCTNTMDMNEMPKAVKLCSVEGCDGESLYCEHHSSPETADCLKLESQLAAAEKVLDSFEKAIRDGSDARLYQDQIKALDDLDFYRIKYKG